MSIPSAEIVGDNTDEAGLDQAIRHNSQVVAEASVNEASIIQETTSLHAEEVESARGASADASIGGEDIMAKLTGSSKSLRSAGVPKAKGSTEGSVYGDVAFEASGLGPLAQAGKMVTEVISNYKDPFAYGKGTTTFDKMIKDGAKKNPLKDMAGKAGKKGGIFTGHFDEVAGMPARVGGVGTAINGADKIKGVKTTKETASALTKKLEVSNAAKMVSQMHLGNAHAQKAKLGAEKQAAVKVAAAPSLTHSGPASGPRFTPPKEEVVEDTQSTWA